MTDPIHVPSNQADPSGALNPDNPVAWGSRAWLKRRETLFNKYIPDTNAVEWLVNALDIFEGHFHHEEGRQGQLVLDARNMRFIFVTGPGNPFYQRYQHQLSFLLDVLSVLYRATYLGSGREKDLPEERLLLWRRSCPVLVGAISLLATNCPFTARRATEEAERFFRNDPNNSKP